MVERIPWNYKWKGGEEIPSWLTFRRYVGLYPQKGDDSIVYENNRIVITKSASSYEMGLSFDPGASNRWENGFIAEFDVDASEFVATHWQKGIIMYHGNGAINTTTKNVTFRNTTFTRVSLDVSSRVWSPPADILVDLESPKFTLRFGVDIEENVYMQQAGDKRRTAAFNGNGKYPSIFLAPINYLAGSVFYIDAARFYVY